MRVVRFITVTDAMPSNVFDVGKESFEISRNTSW